MPEAIAAQLAKIRAQLRERTLPALEGPQGRQVVVGGSKLINFSSNNTLGLANHPSLAEAASRALENYGFGGGAARLLSGNFKLYDELEAALADWLGAESALVFSSGYHANLGLLSTLAAPERRCFSDADNHASIIDGLRLGRSERIVYPHRQPPLERLQAGDLVVTESVFSMEGTAPAVEMVSDIQSRGALAILDEAHAFGWAGEGGSGFGASAFARVGTLGKALGSYGAFVVGSQSLIDLLKSAARSFIFTTALPAPVLAASLAAVRLVRADEGHALRERLRRNCERFRATTIDTQGDGPIFSVPLGDERSALAKSSQLANAGFLVQAVRPPTVPEHACALRVVVCAHHEDSDIDRLCAALEE